MSSACSLSLGGYIGTVSLGLPSTPALVEFVADLGWAYGDLVAGLTVGIVAVPQSMSYAQVGVFVITLLWRCILMTP